VKRKIITICICFLFCFICAKAQVVDGQWKGYFDSKGDIVLSGSNNTEYVLELEIRDDYVTGFSYSYFQGRRYYVICSLEGTYNKHTKSIKVTEMERVKGNTPPDFSDCLQTHFLTYEKEGNVEKLVGRWESAPGQRGGCGVGKTALTRRTLTNDLSSFNKPATKTVVTPPIKKPQNITPKPNKPNIAVVPKKPTLAPPVAKTNPAKPKVKPAPATVTPAPVVVTPPVAKVNPPVIDRPNVVKPAPPKPSAEVINSNGFQNRKTAVLKTIEIENETFTVDLYDNGEVDGDSVSVFYNGKLILSHKRLSDRALTLKLDATTDFEVNELTMYAENLGEIPPNTALMVVTDGNKRYEARISSDLKNSGTIHFIHKQGTKSQ
jgi:hypothetical protein